MNPAAQTVGSILRFDKKVNSYKLALVRALNDVVLSYPDLSGKGVDVCVPLRKLAEYWLAYYWPFVDPQDPIIQGPRATRRGVLGNDMAFRPALTPQVRVEGALRHRSAVRRFPASSRAARTAYSRELSSAAAERVPRCGHRRGEGPRAAHQVRWSGR
jgi:hypothetical protein